jgi:hypothetical protein
LAGVAPSRLSRPIVQDVSLAGYDPTAISTGPFDRKPALTIFWPASHEIENALPAPAAICPAAWFLTTTMSVAVLAGPGTVEA